ncbi:MAG TPA: TRAP transporter substrate-binding protein DctP [Spirochaetia bacterium]|nr:TRAP transporter substrate-binding protein DctP [Spirochaetia bacterium]
MRQRTWIPILLCLAVGILVLAPPAGALTIKLGTLAPVGSPWEIGLRRIAAEWDKLSGGTVVLRSYAGGIAGDEPDMIRKMRIGNLDAAGITVSGLNGIFKGFKTLSYPLLVRNDGELSYVLDHMKPFFEQELEKRGFHAIMWSPGGWVYLFSRKPVVFPQDLRSQKLWVWSGDPDEVRAYQEAGFQTVTLGVTDLMTSLQGGMIDALVTSPLLAASNQWFGIVSNMATIRLGPLWGATIISDKAWSKVPADLQPKLIEAAQKIADSLAPDLVKADDQAIEIMKKYGLTINKVPAKAEAEWADLLDKTFSGLVGSTYDKQSFEMATKYLNDYLATHPRP